MKNYLLIPLILVSFLPAIANAAFVSVYKKTTQPAHVCQVQSKIETSTASNNLPTRNNNPGNIKKTGHSYIGEVNKDPNYETFVDVRWGFAAMFDLLERNYSGKTIDQAINKWAPDFENDTNAYVKYVGDRTGFNTDKVAINVFNLATIIPIIEAMSVYEGGKNWTQSDIYVGWVRWAACTLPAR